MLKLCLQYWYSILPENARTFKQPVLRMCICACCCFWKSHPEVPGTAPIPPKCAPNTESAPCTHKGLQVTFKWLQNSQMLFHKPKLFFSRTRHRHYTQAQAKSCLHTALPPTKELALDFFSVSSTRYKAEQKISLLLKIKVEMAIRLQNW